jgi:hypothetical protein
MSTDPIKEIEWIAKACQVRPDESYIRVRILRDQPVASSCGRVLKAGDEALMARSVANWLVRLGDAEKKK